MVEYVQGYRDVYGKIHETEHEAHAVDEQYRCYQDLRKLLFQRIRLVKWPQPDDIVNYIWHNYEQIKIIMERYGR